MLKCPLPARAISGKSIFACALSLSELEHSTFTSLEGLGVSELSQPKKYSKARLLEVRSINPCRLQGFEISDRIYWRTAAP